MTTRDAHGSMPDLPRDRERGKSIALMIFINTPGGIDVDTPLPGTMKGMARMPDSVKTTLAQRLDTHRRTRWPQLARVDLRYRGEYAYLDAVTTDDEIWPLCRLRYTGTSNRWGFAIHLASQDSYEDSLLPTGLPTGTPEEALDCSCGLYLGDPTAWLQPPKD
jgi:hypothetical protein